MAKAVVHPDPEIHSAAPRAVPDRARILGRQVGATRRHGDPQALVNDSYGWPQLTQQNLCRVVGATGHLVVDGRTQPELPVIAASEHLGGWGSRCPAKSLHVA